MAKAYGKLVLRPTRYTKKAKTYKTKSSIPRNHFPTFPTTMRLAIPFVRTDNFQVAAEAWSTFAIQPITPFQVGGVGPGMLADIMRFYEMGIVVSATVKCTFMSREIGAAEGLSIVASNVNSRDLVRAPAANTFSALQSMVGAQQKYLGPTNGGHDQVTFTNFIQIQNPYSSSFASSVTSIYNEAGQFALVAPGPGAIAESPCVQYMYTPIQPAQCNFQVIQRTVFNIYFSRPHYPRPAITVNQPVVDNGVDHEFQMETESCRSSYCPVQRQVTKGLQKMNVNNYR